MDARDNGNKNPFDNTLYCLEWIASAMEAARRHKEQRSAARQAEGGREARSAAEAESIE